MTVAGNFTIVGDPRLGLQAMTVLTLDDRHGFIMVAGRADHRGGVGNGMRPADLAGIVVGFRAGCSTDPEDRRGDLGLVTTILLW